MEHLSQRLMFCRGPGVAVSPYLSGGVKALKGKVALDMLRVEARKQQEGEPRELCKDHNRDMRLFRWLRDLFVFIRRPRTKGRKQRDRCDYAEMMEAGEAGGT